MPPRQTAGPSKVDWNDPARRQSLVRRGEQSYKDRSGQTRQGLLDFEKLKRHGLSLWEWSAGKKFWDVIPYLCGSQDPEVYAGRLKEGDGTYTSGVFVHKIGPKGMDKVICLAKTYGLPCPICEYREELDRDPDAASKMGLSEKDFFKQIIKPVTPSKYANYLYYIWDRDAEGKGLQVALISGAFFEEALQTQAFSERGGGYTPFMDPGAGPQGGRHIELAIGGSKAAQDWGSGVKFVERREPIPGYILDQALALPLDELWLIPDYKEVYESFHQGQPPEQEEQLAGPQAGYYECFQTGQCGGFRDCAACQFYAECVKGGVAQAAPATSLDDDIPF